MTRVGDYSDDDLVGWMANAPELSSGLGHFADAVYNRSSVPLRTRELARMVIAHENGCVVCLNSRADDRDELGLTDEFYANVPQWQVYHGYTAEEKVAAEFAHRFVVDHAALREDEDFWRRAHEHFDDGTLTDLALSCALWLGNGRAMRVLDVAQACRLTF